MSSLSSNDKPHVLILTHAPRGARLGNRVTALRWAAFIRHMGWRVRIVNHYQAEPADVLIALNARRNTGSQHAFAEMGYGKLILALTGTDIYGGWPNADEYHFAQQHAAALIALQDDMRARLPNTLKPRTEVIYQSAQAPDAARTRQEVPVFLVSGHLREEKAPFLPVQAVHDYLSGLSLHLRHCGGEITAGMNDAAQQWMRRETRYRYYGELPRKQALNQLQYADALINPSQIEGGPAVVTEAIVAGVPVIASDIPAHRSLLGEDYLGFFPVGDAEALAARIESFVLKSHYRDALRQQIIAREPLFQVEHERACLQQLLRDVMNRSFHGV